MNIAFIGGGIMGESMIARLIGQGSAKPGEMVVSDVDDKRREYLRSKYGVRCLPDNQEAAQGSAVIVLSVKPQNLAGVAAGLRGLLEPSQLVLSIVAGASTKVLIRRLEHEAVVRAMPNTPAQVGKGISVWTATESVSEAQRELARIVLTALGSDIYVADEKYIDMATAVSGSGPGYIFLIIEALTDAAVHIGLPRSMAVQLVLQTMIGSVEFAQASGKHAAELRDMVTSPGGTTAEGLLRLEEGGLRSAISQAVIAAYEKAKRLGKEQE